MIDFANYLLPVQYSDGVITSHLHTRQHASLFDVSHMGQLKIYGSKRHEYLETLVPSAVLELKENQSRLSSLVNERGGIIDDCMITNKQGYLYIVVNGACKEKDTKHMLQHLQQFNKKHGTDIRIENLSEQHELLALQGPSAASVLQQLIPSSFDLQRFPFMYSADLPVADIEGCMVARAGYTGEDGFEISVPRESTERLMDVLLNTKINNSNDNEVKAAGLAVRDSLRIEAGLCLYGHDMTEDITPVEAGLKFTIQKRRRENGGFLGDKVIQNQLANGVEKQRIGFIIPKGPPAREDTDILLADTDQKIGTVTSGSHSPCLKKAIGMGYVKSEHSNEGTKIKVVVRGKAHDAEIVKLPFVEAKYYRVPKS